MTVADLVDGTRYALVNGERVTARRDSDGVPWLPGWVLVSDAGREYLVDGDDSLRIREWGDGVRAPLIETDFQIGDIRQV